MLPAPTHLLLHIGSVPATLSANLTPASLHGPRHIKPARRMATQLQLGVAHLRLPQLPSPVQAHVRRTRTLRRLVGGGGFILAAEAGCTGDRTAWTRDCAVLGLALSSVAQVCSLHVAHALLAGAVACSLFFGVRQGAHTVVLQRRALATAQAEGQALSAPPGAPRRMQLLALQRRLRMRCVQARRTGVASGVATLGSAVVGVGLLCRPPLLAGVAPSLAGAAVPLLDSGLGILSAVGIFASLQRLRACQQAHLSHRRLLWALHSRPAVPADDARLRALGRRYYHQLEASFGLDALARAGITAGAPISLFVGPVGLAVLLPAVAGTLVAFAASQRLLPNFAALPLRTQLQLNSDRAHRRGILQADACLHRLRQARAQVAPRLRLPWHPQQRPAKVCAQLLGALVGAPQAAAVVPALHAAGLFEPWVVRLLRQRKLRRALLGRGVFQQGRLWHVDGTALQGLLAAPEHEPALCRRLLHQAARCCAHEGGALLRQRLYLRLSLYDAFLRLRAEAEALGGVPGHG